MSPDTAVNDSVRGVEAAAADQPSAGDLPVSVSSLRRINSAAKFVVMLRCLARTTAEACGFERCSIFLSRDGRLVPAMSQFATGETRAELWRLFMGLGGYKADDVPAFAEAIRERRPVVVRAGERDRLPREWPTFGGVSALVVPLLGERHLVGVMVLDTAAIEISNGQIRRARVLGRTVASGIHRPLSAMQMRSQLRAAETLLSIGRTIGSTLELQEVVRRITRETAKVLGADSAGIYLMTRNQELEPFAAYHMPKEILDSIKARPVSVGNVRDLRMQWSDDVPNDPAFHDPIFREFPTQSLLLAPLRAQEEVVGMLACAWWTERRRLTAEERQLVEGIAGQAATAIVNARLYAEAAQAAIAAERIRVDNLLHDTFRQTLFSIGLRIERSLRGQQRLSTVRSIIQDIKRDVSVMMDQVNLVVALDSPPTACHPAAPASTGETGV